MKDGLRSNQLINRLIKGLGIAVLTMGMTTGANAQLVGDPVELDNIWTVEAGSVDWLSAAGNHVRGAAFNPATGNILVVSRATGVTIQKVNAETGVSSGSMNVSIIEGGILPLNRIAVTEDGQIFATNLILDTGTNFKIYYWANEDATPQLLFEGNPSPFARYGDGIGISGSGNDVFLYVSGTFTAAVAEFYFDGTTLSAPRVFGVPADAANASIVPAGEMYANPDFATAGWMNGRDTAARFVDLETGFVIATVPTSTIPLSHGDFSLLTNAGRTYMVSGVSGTEAHSFLVLDVTNPANVFVVGATGEIGTGNNAFRVGAVAVNQVDGEVYVLATNVALAAFDMSKAFGLSTSTEYSNELVENFVLAQNYPNPFNPTTSIRFELPAAEFVNLTVYNMLGQPVASLLNQQLSSGVHQVQFNAVDLSSGTYIYRIQAGSFVASKRMMLVK
jgi:hypothetical protein